MNLYEEMLTRWINDVDRLAQLATMPEMMQAYYRGKSDGLREARFEHARRLAEQALTDEEAQTP